MEKQIRNNIVKDSPKEHARKEYENYIPTICYEKRVVNENTAELLGKILCLAEQYASEYTFCDMAEFVEEFLEEKK